MTENGPNAPTGMHGVQITRSEGEQAFTVLFAFLWTFIVHQAPSQPAASKLVSGSSFVNHISMVGFFYHMLMSSANVRREFGCMRFGGMSMEAQLVHHW